MARPAMMTASDNMILFLIKLQKCFLSDQCWEMNDIRIQCTKQIREIQRKLKLLYLRCVRNCLSGCPGFNYKSIHSGNKSVWRVHVFRFLAIKKCHNPFISWGSRAYLVSNDECWQQVNIISQKKLKWTHTGSKNRVSMAAALQQRLIFRDTVCVCW